MRKKKNKRPVQPGDPWGLVSWRQRCEDCDLRNALNIVGLPRYAKGVPLTADCENCGGKGWTRIPRRLIRAQGQ